MVLPLVRVGLAFAVFALVGECTHLFFNAPIVHAGPEKRSKNVTSRWFVHV